MNAAICRTSLTVLVGAVVLTAAAAENKNSDPAADPQMVEMMKKMEIAGTPGAAHKALEPMIGSWDVEVKCWMTPGGPPTVTKGTARASWILGRRFVQEEFKGEFLGKTFHGLSLTGYDNTKQKYNSLWTDDMHTSMFTSEGSADAAGKVFTFEGRMDCPLTGEKDVSMKHVVRILSRDKHVFEMYDSRMGDTKSMEITYTRK